MQDVIRAIIMALQNKEAEGHVINIASGKAVSIRSVIEAVQMIVGGGHPKYGAIPYRPKENMNLFAAIDKANTKF